MIVATKSASPLILFFLNCIFLSDKQICKEVQALFTVLKKSILLKGFCNCVSCKMMKLQVTIFKAQPLYSLFTTQVPITYFFCGLFVVCKRATQLSFSKNMESCSYYYISCSSKYSSIVYGEVERTQTVPKKSGKLCIERRNAA